MKLLDGEKHHRRKSAEHKAQSSSVSGTNALLIEFCAQCDLRNFLRPGVNHLKQLHTLILFSISIVFGIVLFFFFA